MYIKLAMNTLRASWLALMLATLFGTRIEARDGHLRVVVRRWRGVTYLVSVTDETPAVAP